MGIQLVNLVHDYEQYKRDTKIVATWLANAGKKLGYPLQEPTTTSHSAKYVLFSGDFVPLAQLIANSCQRESGDQHGNTRSGGSGKGRKHGIIDFIADIDGIKEALRDAIKKRIMFRDIWNSISKSGSDAGHSKFIETLEGVLGILSRIPVQKTTDQEIDNIAAETRALSLSANLLTPPNRFDGLPVSSTPGSDSDRSASSGASRPASQAQPDEPQVLNGYQAEGDQSGLDAFFAFAHMQAAAALLRKSVASLWTSYVNGEAHFMSVAMASNAAIQLVKQMELENTDELSPGGDITCLLHLERLQAMRCDETQVPWCRSFDLLRPPGDLPPNCQCRGRRDGVDCSMGDYLIADETMLLARHMLKDGISVFPIRDPAQGPHYSGISSVTPKPTDWSALSNTMKWEEDRQAFCRFMSDAQYFLAAVPRGQIQTEDELLRSLFAAGSSTCGRGDGNDRVITFAQCFAFSVFLDIHRTFLTKPDAFSRIETEIDECHNDLDLIREVADDFEGSYKQQAQKNKHPPSARTSLGGFLRSHPLYSGLYIHFVRYSMLLTSENIERTGSSLLLSGQLYHALGNLKMASVTRWLDMELLYAVQGGKKAWFSGQSLPKDPEGYWKALDITQGGSMLDWCDNMTGRKQPTKRSSAMPMTEFAQQQEFRHRKARRALRQLQFTTAVPISTACRHSVVPLPSPNDPDHEFCRYKDYHLTLDTVFDLICDAQAGKSEQGRKSVDRMLSRIKSSRTPPHVAEGLKKDWLSRLAVDRISRGDFQSFAETDQDVPLAVLAIRELFHALDTEVLLLNIDYALMFQSSLALHRELIDGCGKRANFERDFEDKGRSEICLSPLIIIDIFKSWRGYDPRKVAATLPVFFNQFLSKNGGDGVWRKWIERNGGEPPKGWEGFDKTMRKTR